MKRHLILIIFLIVVPSLVLSACLLQGETETPEEGRCGDGICDDVEKKNPNLCPEDCPPPEDKAEDETGVVSGGSSDGETKEDSEQSDDGKEPPAGGVESLCATEDWLLTFSGCGNMIGTEPSWDICIVFDSCITVDRNCQISGTGTGKYKTCSYSGACSYEVACSEFNMPVSGEVELLKEGDELKSGDSVGPDGAGIFKIEIDSSNVWEEVVANCAQVTVPIKDASATQVIFGSVHRNGKGYFVELEVPKPIDEDFYGDRVEGSDALYPGLTYSFNVIMYPGCERTPDW